MIYSLAGRGSFITGLNKDKMSPKIFESFDAAVRDAFEIGITGDELISRIQSIQ